MALKKLVGFCYNNCCGEVCYLDSHVRTIARDASISFRRYIDTNEKIIKKFGIQYAPTLLIMKNNAIVAKIIGKVEPRVIIKQLIELGWTDEKKVSYDRKLN